ncbi:peptidase M15D, vanX D-ala-D-ala dipeptidase [Fulvivirga imtechensis AK7]|uniref:D-alanyl-D-alanine dipeptidase n=1 Tax=Fulvivirga imtechensis AK7 TaxID=1237149 RepID=L8JXB5_9BACT|nr:M15 family metallopeptidase [Fulvivirga imtechensis]ELR73435.1 peptidase M15D, vanX D-ala-D-ala dipeptidase [Fulvivirga imtechensis AK7]
MTSKTVYITFLFTCLFGCSSPSTEVEQTDRYVSADTAKDLRKEAEPHLIASLHDTAFVSLKEYAGGFSYDMKYATSDNFLKKVVYDCGNCLVRKEVADALIRANDSLQIYGVHIKFFDCYRPVDVQKQMWEIYPDARYVANPYTTGSIHNRGGAVDITLVDDQGKELDMGTSFDFFGKEAHHAYTNLPDTVLANRKLLKTVMQSFGFNPITTEWWHYNFRTSNKYSLSNFKPACDNEPDR